MIPSTKYFDRSDRILEITTHRDRTRTKRWLPKPYVGEQAAVPLKPPSLARKGVNYAKAKAKHVAAGSPEATDAQVAERFLICTGCELYQRKSASEGECTHPKCGCSLKAVGLTGRNKLRWADQECPIGRWRRVDQRPPSELPERA